MIESYFCLFDEMENKILQAVRKGNLQTIRKYLDPLDLTEYDILTSMKLLNDILNIIKVRQPVGKRKTLDVILDKWQDPDDNDMDLLMSELGAIILISQDNLNYVFETYDDLAIEEILSYNLFDESKEKAFSFGFLASRITIASKQEDILGKDGWLRLLKLAEEKNRLDAKHYILKHLNKSIVYALPPKWMKEYAGKVSSLVEDENKTKDFVRDIFKDAPPDLLNNTLNTFSHTELSTIIPIFSDNTLARRHYIDDPDMVEGPINPIIHEDESVRECPGAMSYRANKSCRMLTCVCIVNSDEDFDLEEINRLYWFIGKCEQCHKKIKQASHCIRLPPDHGGWVGCFCSEECAIETANTEIKENLSTNNGELERYRRFNAKAALLRHKGIVENDNSFFEDSASPSSIGEEEGEVHFKHFDVETPPELAIELPEQVVTGIQVTLLDSNEEQDESREEEMLRMDKMVELLEGTDSYLSMKVQTTP